MANRTTDAYSPGTYLKGHAIQRLSSAREAKFQKSADEKNPHVRALRNYACSATHLANCSSPRSAAEIKAGELLAEMAKNTDCVAVMACFASDSLIGVRSIGP
jgi:hypothetical protein